ncbi:hypothetical protein BO70DRAFT_120585 [Aspergillus heteromorphus CBS 117.55]|uniref:Uncharacterized protein n=1 Tax=Aspergillus heteromorphus CBS 117.55 TaxID=1448321 RepID=A0A317VBC8_9EURO|nr:uncharacterized protein BO70DRAFT_120585 [Aspergillus heteromorphus CBS 117.55]PWY71663.1 hypothetical protein BO70DRAFT_120585 [Aspergillus heteromorphus CBS 117.55]
MLKDTGALSAYFLGSFPRGYLIYSVFCYFHIGPPERVTHYHQPCIFTFILLYFSHAHFHSSTFALQPGFLFYLSFFLFPFLFFSSNRHFFLDLLTTHFRNDTQT